MADRNMKADMNVQFTEASSRQSIESGESVKTLFGKIRKWLSDLKPIAFSGSYNDLSNKPTTGVSGVKGNAETTYRTGNVNLTPDNIGLGNVDNTSDVNKPISTATQTALNNKVSKTGDTMTGTLTYNGAGTVLKNTNLDVNGDNPTSNTWSNSYIEYRDKDNAKMGFINVQRRTDGSTMLEIGAQARNTADTADIYNTIDMLVGRDGARSYGVTDPTAFRKAIGTGNQVTLTGAVTGTGTFSNGSTASVSTTWKSGVVGSNVSDLAGKYWFKVASTSNHSINFDVDAVFLIEDTYYYSRRNAIIKIDTRNYLTIDADGLVYLEFIANNGFSINDIAIVSKYEDSTRKYELWVKNTTAWNAIRTTVLSEGHRGGTLANYWTIYNNFTNSNVGETSYPTDGWTAFFPEENLPTMDQVNYNTNNGVKNLLKVDIPEKTVVGLTFTPQSDGTIIVNGTSTATKSYVVYFNLENPSKTTTNTQHSENKIGYGDFTISLNGEEAYTPGIYLQILCYDSITTNPKVTAQVAYGESKSVMIDTDKKYVWFRLLFDKSINGKVFNNFVCKPMIRSATIEDDTFEPYAEPNSQLTQKVDKALKQTGYNLLEITADTQTINGVTFIVDKAAGTITANGTASQGIWANVSYGKLSAGNYVLSGCPTSSFDKFSLVLYENISSSPFIVYNAGNNTMFTLPNAKNYKLQIRITAGTTLSNLVFKPMIVPAELAGVPFQPYAKSNAELTSGKLDVTGMMYYESYPEQFKVRAQKGSMYYQLELHTTNAGSAELSDSAGGSIGLFGGTPILRNSGRDMLLFSPDGCISGQPANSGSRIGLRNYGSGTYIGFFMGVPGVYDSDDIPVCTFTTTGIKMDNALISGRSGTPTLITNTGTVYEFKDDGIYANGTKIVSV